MKKVSLEHDKKLIAGLLFSPELGGRFDIQGNQFGITIPYLKEYLKKYSLGYHSSESEKIDKIRRLVELLDNLNAHERYIASSQNTRAVSEYFTQQLVRLTPGQELMLPGGWQNFSGGHAMLYRFTKTDSGALVCSIYNSGAGLNFHNQQSTKTEELYSPIKQYTIHSDNQDFLEHLMLQLINPIIYHKDRVPASFNEELLYQNIEFSLALLDAQENREIIKHVFEKQLGTKSQIFGTCTQDSLHQLLKIELDDLAEYQHFIFSFRMHTLHEIMPTIIGESNEILELMQLAIQDNLKLAQKLHGVENEISTLLQYLVQINELKTFSDMPDAQCSSKDYRNSNWEIPEARGFRRAPDSRTEFTQGSTLPTVVLLEEITPNTLRRLIEQWEKAPYDKDPLSVSKQIESLMLQLPLPLREPNPPPEAYQSIDNQEKNEQMLHLLSDIQALYLKVYDAILPSIPLPSHVITHATLLIQLNYFNTQQKKYAPQHASFDKEIIAGINAFLKTFKHNPSLMFQDPVFDKRFEQMQNAYSSNQFLTNINIEKIYQEIIDTNIEFRSQLIYAMEAQNPQRYQEILKTKTPSQIALLFLLRYLEKNDSGNFTTIPGIEQGKFESILAKITAAISFEQKATKSLRKVNFAPMPCMPHYNSFNDFRSPMTAFLAQRSRLSQELQDKLFTFTTSDFRAKTALNSSLSENKIQLEQDSLFERELYQLRVSPTHQINLTLDYFTNNLHRFHDTNVQSYLTANLFEPNLLRRILDTDPSFLIRFDKFIQKGMLFFKEENEKLSESAWYFLKLSLEVHQYAAENAKDPATLALLKEDSKKILEQLSIQQKPDIQASLIHLLFINNTKILALDPTYLDDPEIFHQTMSSYFQVQITTMLQETDTSKFALEVLSRQFAIYLAQHPHKISHEHIQTICEPFLGRPSSEYAITNKDSLFTVTHQGEQIVVDTSRGFLYKNALSARPMPLHLRNNPILRLLNLHPLTPCFISPDNTMIEFNNETRIFQKENCLVAVQKKIKGVWHQLCVLTEAQAQYYQYQDDTYNSTLIHLPNSLTDDDKQLWLSTEKTYSGFITQNNDVCYEITPAARGFKCHYKLIPDQDFILSSDTDDTIRQIYQFEDASFCQINLSENGEAGCIELPRYGLRLNCTKEGTKRQITRPESTYHLLSNARSPFKPEVAHLIFGEDDDPKECIVPVQRFYLEDPGSSPRQAAAHYYRLTHDISGYIADDQDTRVKESLQWHYKDSETTISYPIIHGKPSPQNAADALYLCYLYLGSHEHEKALAILDGLKHRYSLTGSIQEQTYLSWIVDALPHGLSSEATQNSPRDIACQLKALALYADFIKHHDIKKSKSNKLPTSRNELYEQKKSQSIDKFNTNLRKTISALYSQMIKVRSHLDSRFNLEDDECRSLITYARAEDFSGTMGYELLKLKLKHLDQTLNRLIAIEASSPSPQLKQKIKEIETKIAQSVSSMSKSTQLVERKIHLTLDKTYSVESVSYFEFPPDQSTLETTLKKIPIASNTEQLKRIYPALIHLAKDNTHPEHQKLKTICKGYIASSQPDSFIFQAYAVLYKIIEKPDYFDIPTTPLFFSELKERVRTLEVDPIISYQPAQIFDNILATTEDILAQLREEEKQSSPIVTQPTQLPTSLSMLALIQAMDNAGKSNMKKNSERSMLLGAWHAYQQVEKQYAPRSHMSEKEAGEALYNKIALQRGISNENLNDPEMLRHLEAHSKEFHTFLSKTSTRNWHEILQIANHELMHTHDVKLAAGQYQKLTQKDLIRCYFNSDRTQYALKTKIEDKSKIEELHQRIHQALTVDIQHQQIKRLLDVLSQVSKEETPTDDQLTKIGEILLAQNLKEAATDPCLMILQYLEGEKIDDDSAKGILLRQEQIHALNSLLGDDNVIEKIIMGGGKSKVILPLVAQKKADGNRLVIFEVPEALLDTNHSDFNEISQRLFGQKAHRFEFNRTSDCSPQKLEDIYQYFSEILTQQDYLVTTGNAMQSLELKLLELLISGPMSSKDQELWEKQIYWAEKITLLLKSHGFTVIDEVHQGLLLKKKLNYTLGDAQKINKNLVSLQIHLFEFINRIEPDFIKKPERLTSEFLAQALLLFSDSPMRKYTQQLENLGVVDWEAPLSLYFRNEAQPDFLPTTDSELNDALAFYKEQLKLLPQTLAKHYKEHYGPQKSTELPLIERIISVPYAANNKPAGESTRFGNTPETLNYTVQSLLIEGLNEELLTMIVAQWHASARLEMQQTQSDSFEETSIALTVKLLLRDTEFTHLQSLDFKNKSQMQAMLAAIKQRPEQHKELLFYALEHHILEKIQTEASILHSNAQNHTSLFRTTHGVSGTAKNHRTQALSFNESTSLGTDGYIQKIVTEKKTVVKKINFDDLESFLEKTMHPGVHAIIDICAMFEKLSNLEVAQALVTHCKKDHDFRQMKYILYFEDIENVDTLCALDTKTNKKIVLGTSNPDEINRKLNNCPLHQRFTYYDQAHHVGVDLKQPEYGQGLCLVDEKTQMQSFLQGCMRMRGLPNTQTIEIIVPETTSALSLEGLLDKMVHNEETQLKDDVFYAAIEKLSNIIREEAMRLIYSLDESDLLKKHEYAKIIAPHIFIEIKSNDLYQQYGQIYTQEQAKDILENQRDTLLARWKERLDKLQLPCPHESDITDKMNAIIEESIPFCGEKYLSPLQHSNGSEVEVQKEVAVLKEIQQEIHTEKERLIEQRYQPCKRTDIERFGTAESSPLNTSLTSLLSLSFSPHLCVSSNYKQVYLQQDKFVESHTKPAHVILFRKIDEQLSACIISIQEADDISTLINQGDLPQFWLSTTEHTALSKGCPEGISASLEYQTLIEQVKFFNGQLDDLIQQKEPFVWLNHDTDEKLDLFIKYILPFRDTTLGKAELLRAALSHRQQYLKDVLEHAFDPDLNKINWAGRYPSALTADIFEMRTLACAINDANHHRITSASSMSLAARSQLQQHMESLDQIKPAVDALLDPKKSSLDFFKDPKNQCLEKLFYPPLSMHALLSHYKTLTSPNELMAQSYASLDILSRLIHHPFVEDKARVLEKIKTHVLTQSKSLNYILEHPSDTIIEALLFSLHKFPEPTLEKLVEKTNSINNLQKILEITTSDNTVRKVFQKITSQAMSDRKQMLLTLLSHPALSVELLHNIVELITSGTGAIYINLLLIPLLKHPLLKSEEKDCLLHSKQISLELRKTLILNKEAFQLTSAQLSTLVQSFQGARTADLLSIIKESQASDTLDLIISHCSQRFDDTICHELLTHQHLNHTKKNLIVLLKRVHTSEQISLILNQLTPEQDYYDVLKELNDAQVVLALALQFIKKSDNIDAFNLLVDQLTPCFIKHPEITESIIHQILNKSDNVDAFNLLVDQLTPCFIKHPEITEGIIHQIILNKLVNKTVFDKIKTHLTTSQLAKLIEKKDEDILAAIISHPNNNLDNMIKIAKATTRAETLYCLTKTPFCSDSKLREAIKQNTAENLSVLWSLLETDSQDIDTLQKVSRRLSLSFLNVDSYFISEIARRPELFIQCMAYMESNSKNIERKIIKHDSIPYELFIKLLEKIAPSSNEVVREIIPALKNNLVLSQKEKLAIKQALLHRLDAFDSCIDKLLENPTDAEYIKNLILKNSNEAILKKIITHIASPISSDYLDSILEKSNKAFVYRYVLPRMNEVNFIKNLVEQQDSSLLQEYFSQVKGNTFLSSTQKNDVIKSTILKFSLEQLPTTIQTLVDEEILNGDSQFLNKFIKKYPGDLIDVFINRITLSSFAALIDSSDLPRKTIFKYICRSNTLTPDEKLTLLCISDVVSLEVLENIADDLSIKKELSVPSIAIAFINNKTTSDNILARILKDANYTTWEIFFSTRKESRIDTIPLIHESNALTPEEKKSLMLNLIEQSPDLLNTQAATLIPYLPTEETHPGYDKFYSIAQQTAQNSTKPAIELAKFVVYQSSLETQQHLLEATEHIDYLREQIKLLKEKSGKIENAVAFILSAIHRNLSLSEAQKVELYLQTLQPIVRDTVRNINAMDCAADVYRLLLAPYPQAQESVEVINNIIEQADCRTILPLLNAMSKVENISRNLNTTTRNHLGLKLANIPYEIPHDDALRREIKAKLRICLNIDSTNPFKQALTVMGLRTPPQGRGRTPGR